jgi:galactokinase
VIDPLELGRVCVKLFGGNPRFFFAPGRVNLIGEHTDYNEGFVLPVALTMGTLVAGVPRADRRVRAHSIQRGETREFDLDRPGSLRTGDWQDYVEGVAQELEQAGSRLGGADLVLSSDVPIGAGLSSSAALEVSVGLALLRLSGHAVNFRELAQAGREAERQWVGVQSGIMDQFAAVHGRKGHALLIDCRSLEISPVPLDASRVSLLLCNSQEEHELAGSEYNTRRDECRRAVERIREAFPGSKVDSLRDVEGRMLQAFDAADPVMRRARHVVEENQRTLEAAGALSRGDFAAAGMLMKASHESLRRLFEVSTPRLDFLVDQASRLPGVYGARMTGGGFGGCTVNLISRDTTDDFLSGMTEAWSARFDTQPVFYSAEAGDGAVELAA